MNLGPPINTPVTDGDAVLSPDGLSLYYDSDRTDLPGARGARDLWVSRRACDDALDPACAWQTPTNLGPLINTPHVDLTPEISDDGPLLFFASHTTRDDCPADPAAPDPTRPCDEDIFVSWRADPTGDLGWSAPVRLGPEVNSDVGENAPEFVAAGAAGDGNLYFNRAIGGSARGFDIYAVTIRVTRRGDPSGLHVRALGPAVPMADLNLPNVFDGRVTVRADGKELDHGSSGVTRVEVHRSTIPARAARAFSSRCNGSGTLRIWITPMRGVAGRGTSGSRIGRGGRGEAPERRGQADAQADEPAPPFILARAGAAVSRRITGRASPSSHIKGIC